MTSLEQKFRTEHLTMSTPCLECGERYGAHYGGERAVCPKDWHGAASKPPTTTTRPNHRSKLLLLLGSQEEKTQ